MDKRGQFNTPLSLLVVHVVSGCLLRSFLQDFSICSARFAILEKSSLFVYCCFFVCETFFTSFFSEFT